MLRFRKLFKPVKIGNIEIKNRIVMSPMNVNFAAPDGSVTSTLVKYFEERARGGAGLLITGYSFIGGESSRSADNQIGIQSDRMIPGLNHLTDSVHVHGAKIFVQLSYIGRRLKEKTMSRKKLDIPPLSLPGDLYRPDEYSLEDIKIIVDLFGQAAKRAKSAGFDGVEIAATQGELPFSFMSPYLNKRHDDYGGDLGSRMRFSLEVLDQIRKTVGNNYPVGFRFGADGDDYYLDSTRGLSLEESVKIAKIVEDAGADYLNMFRAMFPMYVPKGTLTTAENVKREVSIPIIAVSSFTDPAMAEKALIEEKIDLVAFGRALIADPELPRKTMENRHEDILKCIRCNECFLRAVKLQFVKCAVNVRVGSEAEKEPQSAKVKKRVAVIGGGPAGLEAALTAASRGHEVTLYEKKQVLGGNLIPGSRPEFKADIRSLADYLNRRIKNSTVNIMTGIEAKSETLVEEEFDAAILAVGAEPAPLGIVGERNQNVFSAIDALNNPQIVRGSKAVIVGGGAVGCETALFISNKGKEVEILEIADDILLEEEIEFNKIELKRMLNEAAIEIQTRIEIQKITNEGLEACDKKGNKKFIPADSVIIAAGFKPNRTLINKMKESISECYCIGDCVAPRKIYHAIHEGFQIGALI
ncbi:MAG: FAD-dependent oxidoreductase [Candidatus Bathyarchaeia archaeon]